ncbi:MAG: hypothetical protein PHV74_06745 [Dehalococcoidia bacterium]|nr:hypothetical protein [Dehalococcoidia bacterium]
MRIVEAVLGIIILIMLVTYMLVPVVLDVQRESYSEVFDSSTEAAETTESCALTYNHEPNNIEDISISSNNELDSPIVVSYTDSTKVVIIGGLAESDTRYLTIGYIKEAPDTFNLFGWINSIPTILLLVGVFGAIAGLFVWGKNKFG